MKHKLPPLGNRIVKTGIAVFICLVIYYLRGFRGAITQSTIAAILCVQPTVSNSRASAMERVLGTLIGYVWAFAYLLVMYLFPILGKNILVAYGIMALTVMLAVYSTVVLKKTSSAALTGIVVMCLVSGFPNVSEPFTSALNDVVDTTLGTLVAIAVNSFRLPRKKHPEYLFFVRTQDLVPDRYQHIPSTVHFQLDYLYNDGAKICLVSRWAPAFIISQMGLLNVNAPIIVMDGAGLYDIRENKYLEVIDIPHNHVQRLLNILHGLGASCNIYAVQDQTMCIYHFGEHTYPDQKEHELLKRSPYRNYLEGTYQEADKIAFIRVIDTSENIQTLAKRIKRVLPPAMYRMEIREEVLSTGYSGLYFYHPTAKVELMKKRMIKYLKENQGQELIPKDILPQTVGYTPEHDAPLLLNHLKSIYEPVSILPEIER